MSYHYYKDAFIGISFDICLGIKSLKVAAIYLNLFLCKNYVLRDTFYFPFMFSELCKKSSFSISETSQGNHLSISSCGGPDTLMDARLWVPGDQNIRRKFDTESIPPPMRPGSHRELYQKLTALAFNFENHLICFNLFKTKLYKSKEISKLQRGASCQARKVKIEIFEQ